MMTACATKKNAQTTCLRMAKPKANRRIHPNETGAVTSSFLDGEGDAGATTCTSIGDTMYASANFFEHFLKLCGETYKATTLSSPWSGARAVSPPPSFRWLVLFVNGFALLKHIACALYLAAQVVIFRNMEPTQRRIAHAFALPTVVVVYMSLAAVHGASSNRRVDPTNRRAFAWLLKWITHKHALAAYNVVQLGCQSYEAIAFATKVVDHTLVAIYVTLVAPHAMVTPWVVYGYHSTPRLLLLNWFSSLSFNLSCIVHIVGLIMPLLRFY
ncbi:Aste57867_7991 [Aphanomyces stellatus]|uniref:Aste57867_7986 protein n=1 Tax=Aphanomyces stellatus TaxID=120398 RepID=A0A485KJ58_9STRA|nr:hypothetical protein As57867_007956 [Aphanomyces stellatus]KAF0701581.1 hypothetical protein As57867_007961 [Aphanomyces stellatus]VFT84879.1 Aste57867_7986 [Aphanomyces stellatus]VFT84884.1 Aste57867_7991 [Aphanomyces stellatus]